MACFKRTGRGYNVELKKTHRKLELKIIIITQFKHANPNMVMCGNGILTELYQHDPNLTKPNLT